MKVTFMQLYHYPEVVSSNYVFDNLMAEVIMRGGKVDVVTPYPVRGIDSNERRKYRKIKKELQFQNQMIHRVYAPFDTNSGGIKRFIRYFFVAFNGARKIFKLDTELIFVQSDPPIFYALWVGLIGRLLKIPVIYNIQDLAPDNLMTRRGFAYKLLNHFHIKAMKRATHITTISEDIKAQLVSRKVKENKVTVIHNWSFEPLFPSIFDVKGYLNAQDDDFHVIYAGNIGHVQNMDIIIDAAKLLKDYEQIKFHIVGDGIRKNDIKDITKDIPNILMHDKIDLNEVDQLYGFADINLITLKKGIIFTALPSKTGACIKAKKPIIACVDENSKYAEMINHYELGSVVDPNDAKKLSEVILNYFLNKPKLSTNNFEDCYHTYFSKNKNIDTYMKLFHHILEGEAL